VGVGVDCCGGTCLVRYRKLCGEHCTETVDQSFLIRPISMAPQSHRRLHKHHTMKSIGTLLSSIHLQHTLPYRQSPKPLDPKPLRKSVQKTTTSTRMPSTWHPLYLQITAYYSSFELFCSYSHSADGSCSSSRSSFSTASNHRLQRGTRHT
jgi:hypothetical protein